MQEYPTLIYLSTLIMLYLLGFFTEELTLKVYWQIINLRHSEMIEGLEF